MSRFDRYFLMGIGDVIEYTLEKMPDIAWNREAMQAKEIGDGNLYTYPVSRVYSISINIGF